MVLPKVKICCMPCFALPSAQKLSRESAFQTPQASTALQNQRAVRETAQLQYCFGGWNSQALYTHIHILVQSLAPVACIGRTGNSGIFFQSKQHWSGILTPQHSSVTSCGQHEPKELWKLRIEAWVPSQGFIRVGVEHQDTKSTGLKTTD